MIRNLPFLFLLLLLCVANLHAQNVFDPNDVVTEYDDLAAAGSAANPAVPATGVMAKWIKTTRLAWNTTNFKCYMWNGMAFRMRFPNNYNAANVSKYPVMIFFHGGGEIGTVQDNENQLVWGAQVFEQRINSGQWNGFLIFPQETAVGWDDSYFSRINGVLDTLQKYNHADPDRTITMGLSAGGYGAIAYAGFYPKRVAAALASSPANISTLAGSIGNFLQVPVWVANGGVDANPDPYNVQTFYTSFRNAGGNIYQTYYVNNGHNTWTDMWNQKNISGAFMTTAYWNTAHKAQPVLYFQNQQFCAGSPISARMAITAGYYLYEWQQNGSTVPGAVSNEYTATQAGQYRVRFMRVPGGSWSDWSPNPVTISTKACAADTLYAEHFNNDNPFATASAYTQNNFTCQDGIRTSGTDMFTQDAAGIQGSRFLVNYTREGTGCVFAAGDKVWNAAGAVTVSPNTNYEFSFYLGNQSGNNPAQLAPAINGAPLTTSAAQALGAGNSSWTKFSYTWNSGNAVSADLSIINRTGVASGNEFVLDEISFKPAAIDVVPNCTVNTSPVNAAKIATSTTALLTWKRADNAASYDVYVWKGTAMPSVATASVTDTSFTATGLEAATQYSWYVAPKNRSGITAAGCSNNQTSFTTAISLVLPSCASNTSPANGATIAATSTALLQWTAAASATSYDVYLWTGAVAPATATASVTGLSYNANGLTAGTLYNWFIVPKNALGQATGCGAKATVFTTATDNPFPPCVNNTSPADGAVLSSSSKATLTWTAGATATSYEVYLWKGATAPGKPVATVKTNSYNATGLNASSLYNWYVVPNNADGLATGCISTATSFNTAAPFGSPSCVNNKLPVNGTVLDTRTTAVLTWTPSITALFYDVYLWKGDAVPATPVTTVLLGTTYFATGLTPSSTYNWFVVPRNLLGLATGCSSNKTSFTTAAIPGLPACTKNILPANGAAITTPTTATVTWEAAANTNQYDLYVWKDATPPSKPTATIAGTSYNLTNLSSNTMYNWYVAPKNAVGQATGCSSNKTSFTTSVEIVRGTGIGLEGDYYNSDNLKGLVYLLRIDPTVNFTWGNGSPSPVIGNEKFSVRWTGLVQPLHSETYTFYTISDGGVRLWVNGKKLINHWSDQSGAEYSGTITLEKGVKYYITLEYREKKSQASVKLLWSGASTPKAIIPQKQLYLPPIIFIKGKPVKIHNDSDDDDDDNEGHGNDDHKVTGVNAGLYPNPVSRGQQTKIQINGGKAGTATVQISGLMGNIVQRETFVLDNGISTKTIHTENLRPGLYVVRVTDSAGKVFAFKLIVH